LEARVGNAPQMGSATTLCIVNLQPNEAKVEAIFESFVSLREEVEQGGANAGAPDNFFMYDDDDGNYQVGVTCPTERLENNDSPYSV
jgi:hypothetical protein